jgi:hypothetical protein
MAYIEVISLEDAKAYLGVDDTARDAEIERMIDSALSYVEEHSSHVMFERDKTYYYRNGKVSVYDFPINTVPTGVTEYKYKGYSTFCPAEATDKSVTLNVGYSDPAEIPYPLMEAGYVMLGHLFDRESQSIPSDVHTLIRSHSRHVI